MLRQVGIIPSNDHVISKLIASFRINIVSTFSSLTSVV